MLQLVLKGLGTGTGLGLGVGVGFRVKVRVRVRPQAGVRALQAIIEAVGVAIPQLSSVISLFMILFIIFCLSGVSLFSGSFRRRCVLPTGPDPSDYVYSYTPWFCGNQNAVTHKTKVRASGVPLVRLGNAPICKV